jgi:ribonuclease HI
MLRGSANSHNFTEFSSSKVGIPYSPLLHDTFKRDNFKLTRYRHIAFFTGGSAIGNPGPGGWGADLMHGNKYWEISGAHPGTTVSEMELVAAAQALRLVPDRARVEFHSHSEYLIYGMRFFVFHWQRHGWRNWRGEALQHRELWAELIALNVRFRIRWI